ncbi:MAG: heteropolysaccharide repeat-containing protein, partial [Candidatus Berkelbacteria bacterium Licking1014_85]
MSYTRKVAYNTFIQVFGKIVVTVFAIISVNILTRYLGVEGYGRYTIIFAYVGFWNIFTDFGILTILTRELAQNENEKAKIFNNTLTFRIFMSFCIILLSIIIARFLNYDLAIKNGIIIMSIAFFFQTLNMTFISMFQNSYQMYKGVITDIVGKLIILIGIIYAVKASENLMFIVATYIVGNIINIILSYLYANNIIKVRLEFDYALWKKLFLEALPIGLMGVFGYLYFKSDALILSLMKGNYDVGIYGPTYKIFEILIVLPAFLIGAAFPAINNFFVNDKVRFQKIIQKIFNFLISVSIPMGLAGIILARPILIFISGGGEFIQNNIFWHNFAFSGI